MSGNGEAPRHSTPTGTRAPSARLSGPTYRVWQVWRALTPRPLDATERAILASYLPAAGEALFATMSRADQRHSLEVHLALRDLGHDDPDLLAAALLHDCGKGSGRVRFWVRPPFVLLRALTPGLLGWLAAEPHPWWRRPFFNAWRHADVGADLAAAAGLSERTVLLVRTHHDAGGPAAHLHAVDESL